jgi:hypothetical protein
MRPGAIRSVDEYRFQSTCEIAGGNRFAGRERNFVRKTQQRRHGRLSKQQRASDGEKIVPADFRLAPHPLLQDNTSTESQFCGAGGTVGRDGVQVAPQPLVHALY